MKKTTTYRQSKQESLFKKEFTLKALSAMGNPLEQVSALVDFPTRSSCAPCLDGLQPWSLFHLPYSCRFLHAFISACVDNSHCPYGNSFFYSYLIILFVLFLMFGDESVHILRNLAVRYLRINLRTCN